jgi:hypothetical protein
MTTVAGFFCFYHEVPAGKPGATKLAIAYKPPGPLQRGSIDELILAMCRGPVVPDALVLVSIAETAAGDMAEVRADSTQLAQQRIAGRIAFIHAQYSLKKGDVRCTMLDASLRGGARRFEDMLRSARLWMDSGLRSVFDPDEVVLRAPPGYAYQKPSGSRAEYFLKPDLGLKSSANVAFVAFCLFDKLYAGRTQAFEELQTVYVDTMAIAPVAYALRDLLAAAGYRGAFSIESFHSYDGIKAISTPLPGTSLCLISASSSMSMHEQWIAEKRVPRQEVATLLTLSGVVKTLAQGALLAIEYTEPSAGPGPTQLSIRIKGETFLPDQEPPKKVLLTDLYHRSDDDVRLFRDLLGTGVFDTFRRPAWGVGKTRALYVDGDRLLQQRSFLLWLEEQLLHSIKAAVRVIIYQKDEQSRRLAELAHVFCTQRLGLKRVRVVSALALSEEKLASTDGVIVCAAVVGKGSQLLEVSRTLRDKHEGPRLYVVGFQVAEARSEIGALRGNLVHSKSVPYDFARFGASAIGTQLMQSFLVESQAYYGSARQLNRLPGLMAPRAQALGSTTRVGPLAFLPHGNTLNQAAELRPGFAFWDPGYVAQACQPEVLATVAVLLQRAREERKLPEERRLASSTFRQVVLDPENFSRFNDGVLQAALLRNAYASELDYRSDHAASDFMKSLILRALARSTEQAGEALLEFVLAIAVRRLQLSDVHLRELLDELRRVSGQPRAIQDAIAFLLASKGKAKIAPAKLPF